MSEYRDFSSLPPDKEQQFVVYEKTSVESAAKAKKLGMIVSGVFGVLVIIIVLSFDKPKNLMAEDDDKSAELKKSSQTTETKAPAAPKPDPAATAPDTTTGSPEGTEGAATDGTEGAATNTAAEDNPSDGEAAKTDG